MTDSSGLAYVNPPRFRLPRWEHVQERIAGAIVRFGLRLLPESNLIRHARTELRLAGLFDADSSYGGMLGQSTLDLMKLFAIEGHSGFSAGMQTSIFEKVSRYQPLTPLTGSDDEWTALDYNDDMAAQNKRCSHVFKKADGTAYDIQGRVFREPSGACFTSRDSRVLVTFPYTPSVEYVDVPEAV